MLPKIIQTEHLILRPWKFADVDAVLEYATTEEWSKFLPVPLPYERCHAEQFIASQIILNPDKEVSYAIEYSGKQIGGINARFNQTDRLISLGYSLSPKFWNKGFMTEAIKSLISEIFRSCPEINKIRAHADVRNTASIRVMEKSNMKKEGLIRQNRLSRNEFVDDVTCGILRSEWSV